MAGSSEADESDGGTDEATDDASGADTESETVGGRRMVEAGAGADVPVDDGGAESSGDESEDTGETQDVASDGGGTDAADAAEDAVSFEDVVEDGDADSVSEDDATETEPRTADGLEDDAASVDGAVADDPPDAEQDAADDADADADDGDGTPDVPPELRRLLAESDDADVETLAEEVVGDSTASETATASGAEGDGVSEHRPDEPTDLATTDSGGENLATAEGAEEPAAETEPVSMRSEMSPVLAERQAFLSLLLALGAGALFATLGNVLRLTRWQTIMVLVSAGIVVLLIATFVVFRAMLAAAERNDEPYKTAYTHPLFMFLFGLTTVVTALFVGYVSRLLT